MVKTIRKTMTDAQFYAAIDEFNSRLRIPKLRGIKASRAHHNNKRYSRRIRREGKQINESYS